MVPERYLHQSSDRVRQFIKNSKNMKKKPSLVRLTDGTSLLVPFILITSLFFLWGFAHSILDVLNKHFQDALGITKNILRRFILHHNEPGVVG